VGKLFKDIATISHIITLQLSQLERAAMNHPISPASNEWQTLAHQCFLKGNYSQAMSLYEQAIAAEPDIKSHYWHLGLVLLVQGQEEEAQTVWMLAIAEVEPDEIEQHTNDLVQVLQTEAERREATQDYSIAWLIRQHIREIDPAQIHNLLILFLLAIELKKFDPEELSNSGLSHLLQIEPKPSVNHDLLMELLYKILDVGILHPAGLEFVEACIPYIEDIETFVGAVIPKALNVAFTQKLTLLAVHLAELCLKLAPENIEVLAYLATFYRRVKEFAKSREIAQKRYELSTTLLDRIYSNHLLLQGLMCAAGYWDEARSVFEQQEKLLLSLPQASFSEATPLSISRLSTSGFAFPYFRNDLAENRNVQNQIAETYLTHVRWENATRVQHYQQRSPQDFLAVSNTSNSRLKIGYLSHCLSKHSVGWLARSLFQHHDRDRVELYGYFVCYRRNDAMQDWYVNQVEHGYKLEEISPESTAQVAEQIYQDGIQILIDLDSITLDLSFDVMARKPAPVQATWLGWDASGLPTIDYFIADPYVLPNSAQEYYREKIWRLPQTYIGLDGFEVATPTLRRDELDIPQDAIVYLSAQNGFKRNPDTARLQMQILKAVPNSYFLVKGIADEEAIQRSFFQIATEVGVSCDRLRFIPEAESEAIHRANLSIADIVLDTYPYNGATTTLETLWMEVPLVTRVGETFSSRNSYTMLKNVGVAEGIAWTDEKYVEWGIRFGTDAALRQKVIQQLHLAKRSAPLWHGKQFAQAMEQAYEHMWLNYLDSTEPIH
jgi:predicted O-linked N-acetylglucosamine transferase (SPINDLY family)